MSRFIDKLKEISRTQSQPIGFKTKSLATANPKMQLVACLTTQNAGELTGYVDGADAGLLLISTQSSDAETLRKIAKAMPDIPWGAWLKDGQAEIKQLTGGHCDFIIFPAARTPLAALPQNKEIGKILAVETTLAEGLLRASNELPIDAVFIAGEEDADSFLTWQHLMLFQRLADILSKPLLVSVPANVTAGELQAIWEAGIHGVIVSISPGQPKNRLKELRQIIDKLAVPQSHQRRKMEPVLPQIARQTEAPPPDEEEEEE